MRAMPRPGVRNALVFSVLASLVALLLRSLRSAPLPASSTPAGGSAPSTTLAPATTEGDAAAPSVEPTPVAEPLPGIDKPEPPTDPLIAETGPEVAPGVAKLSSTLDPDWVDAVGGEPGPSTHPVKAKLSSGIYHVPGGLSYERTRPDRWYRSVAAAEADGLRAAKR